MNPGKKTLLAAALSILLFGTAMPAFAQHSPENHATTPPAAAAPSVSQAAAALRDLWLGHVFWVRNVVLETQAGNKAAAKAAEAEVVANARQIANSIEPFYGKPAADTLFKLLAGHYGAIKQYLEATVAGSRSQQDAAMKNLTDNVEEIAVFLSGANPNLPRDTVRGLLLAHGGHHVQQIQQLHDRQYEQEARTWAAMKDHMYVIADALAGALAKQFPAKFS
ncbi:MAG: hypothetical protein ACM3X0_03110 [Bacteroidota bacterium]